MALTKFDEPTTTEPVVLTEQQSLYQELAELIRIWKRKANRWPDAMPTTPQEAIRWFLNLLEPKDEVFERPKHVPVKTKKGVVLVTRYPYVYRVHFAMKRFFIADPDFQRLIINAREDKIFWRGDTREFFLTVIRETLNMREIGRDQYIAQAKAQLAAAKIRIPTA